MCVIAALGPVIQACEVHDYWSIPDVLKVDSENDHADADLLETDLFVRYQVDYSVTNTEAEPTSVVVQGTSYVNEIKRTTGMKVWQLDENEVGNGILTSSMLQYGNALQVSLVCCNQSSCSKNEVICPENSTDNQTGGTDTALFCYRACHDTTRCLEECPALEACDEYCYNVDPNNMDKCMETYCSKSGTVQSCAQYCDDDEQCIESCNIYPICRDNCASTAAACFKNCVSTWSQCTDSVFENVTSTVPCSLCASGLEKATACRSEVSSQPEMDAEGNPILQLKEVLSETVHTCTGEYDCQKYPSVCLTDCEEIYQTEVTRMNCVDACIQQHLFWCNDFSLTSEYIDTRYNQPCCYESNCHAEMTGIVKTMEVQCFDNSSCSSNHYCSDDGVCTENVASSCSTQVSSRAKGLTLIAMAALGVVPVFLAARRRKHRKSRA